MEIIFKTVKVTLEMQPKEFIELLNSLKPEAKITKLLIKEYNKFGDSLII